MSGITTTLRRLLVALLALGIFSATAAPPASAQTPLVGQFFEERELTDVNRAAAYLGMQIQEFAQASVEVHYFLLAIAGKLQADECLLGYGNSITGHSGDQVTWFEYPGELGTKFDTIMNHYCLDEGQTQRFNLTLLTFLAGANASQGGLTLPDVGAPSHAQRTNGYDPTPAEGWAANLQNRLDSLTRHDLTMADNAACVGGGHPGYEDELGLLYWDAMAHSGHTDPDLLLFLDDLFVYIDEHRLAACDQNLDLQLHYAGVFRFMAFDTSLVHALHNGFTPQVGPLSSHPVTQPDQAFDVWTLINGILFLFFDSSSQGLYVGSCFNADESFYLDIVVDLDKSPVAIADYVAATPALTDADRAALEAARLGLIDLAVSLRGLHESLCREPIDRNAAVAAVGVMAEQLFRLAHLSNVGSLT